MRKIVLGMAILLAGTAQGATVASIAASLGANYVNGVRPNSVYGTCFAADNFGFMLNPNVDYSYAIGGSVANGDTADYHWVHETSAWSGSGAGAAAGGTKWRFANMGSQYYLDPAIDHEPAYEESFETTLWGSNDGGTTWILGVIDECYELGFSASGITENGSHRWTFSQPVNLISATWGLTQGGYSYHDGDTEIDCVSQALTVVPLPTGSALALVGLAGLAVRRRR